jgi:serine/threonine protein phosphatase 1
MRTFIMGDIHGEHEKLTALLEQVNFNYAEDTLIQLGDVVDRGPDVYSCVEELLKIKNLIAIRGNHDFCWLEFLKTGQSLLYNQGAMETEQSYVLNGVDPSVHFDFFNDQLKYYIDQNNNFFVHGGFNRHKHVDEENDPEVFYWDRDLWLSSLSYANMKNQTYPFKMKDKFNHVFIGHTPTKYWDDAMRPITAANITNLDTGSGKGGLLTIMNLETREYWQI